MRRVRPYAAVAIALAALAGLASPVAAGGPAADTSAQATVGPIDAVWQLARSIYLETLDALGWLDAGTARDGFPADITAIFDAGDPAIGAGNGGPIEGTAPTGPEEEARSWEPR